MELTKRQILYQLWPFFSYKLLKGACFITTITFFIFFNNKNINYFEASALLSLLFLLPVFFETITGVIADTIGRKFSVLIGIFGELLIIIGIIFTSNYLLLLILFALWGIVTTFASGADDAWAIELIPEQLREKFLDHYYSLSSSSFSLGMIVAGSLSSLLIFIYGNQSVWFARLFFVILIFVILSFTKENFRKTTHNESHFKAFYINLAKGLSHFWNNLNTRNIVLGEFFATLTLVGIGSASLQKYLLESSLLESNWGLVYSISAIVGVFIPLFAMQLSKKFSSQKKYLIFVFISQAVLYLSASIILNPLFAIVFIFLHNNLEDAFNPVNSSFFHKEIPSNIRATLSSLQSTSLGLAAFTGTILGGFLTNQLNGQLSIGILTLFLLPAIIFYTKIKTPIS
ncbi:MFS transporter [Candidatus Parcubacteria bacterium]|nr:MFS transporter [Candidatus Parcubacteria bacterium]